MSLNSNTYTPAHYCPSYPCPYCTPFVAPVFVYPPQPIICTPAGCICPPKSEQTCGNKFCPRKDPLAPKIEKRKRLSPSE